MRSAASGWRLGQRHKAHAGERLGVAGIAPEDLLILPRNLVQTLGERLREMILSRASLPLRLFLRLRDHGLIAGLLPAR